MRWCLEPVNEFRRVNVGGGQIVGFGVIPSIPEISAIEVSFFETKRVCNADPIAFPHGCSGGWPDLFAHFGHLDSVSGFDHEYDIAVWLDEFGYVSVGVVTVTVRDATHVGLCDEIKFAGSIGNRFIREVGDAVEGIMDFANKPVLIVKEFPFPPGQE